MNCANGVSTVSIEAVIHMTKKAGNETPMMRQFNEVKAKYPEALVLFRVGDFYETFGGDAILAAQALGIVLTKRNNGTADLELAGFPHHAVDNYIPKLVKAGFKVVVCDQLEDPKLAKGLVKRGVTEVITPGTATSDKILDIQTSNYLAAICMKEAKSVGLALLELSTGEFFGLSASIERVEKLLYGFRPSEVLVCRAEMKAFQTHFNQDFNITRQEDWIFELNYAQPKLLEHFSVSTLKGFGIAEDNSFIIAAGAILHYLNNNEQRDLRHIQRIYRFFDDQYLVLDQFTIRNLEILSSNHPDGHALFQVLAQGQTAMGARLLKRWLLFPLMEQAEIEGRLDTIEAFIQNESFMAVVEKAFKAYGDPERLLIKLANKRITPRECWNLLSALDRLAGVIAWIVEQKPNPMVYHWASTLADLLPLRDRLRATLQPECPHQLQNGGVILAGVSAKLDEYRLLQSDVNQALADVRDLESKRSGITSLKVGYNKVFGYYFEISNTHRTKVPEHFVRRQTLVNAERFITRELKQFEDKILAAEEQILRIETEIFEKLVQETQQEMAAIQQHFQFAARLDTLWGLAKVAKEWNYSRPTFNDEGAIEIIDGRHPVIETLLPRDNPYIPNDVYLDDVARQILIITGPNMAGKSALLRQTALIAIMAQVGCWVPARQASLPLIDKIFSRVGASDNISAGESTFMVEMMETARIMNNATERSLVILDEIGRGTSTFDGLAIAIALVEHLHNTEGIRPKTLFATHYHELSELASRLARLKNFHVEIAESGSKIIFLRKLRPGSSTSSFGVHVAEMAGMPKSIVERANEVLQDLTQAKPGGLNQRLRKSRAERQLSLFPVENPELERIKAFMAGLNINAMTPTEALLKLVELKEWVEKIK
jgi:DNA mismatch repair protein MutS